jgi:hypothetical protein
MLIKQFLQKPSVVIAMDDVSKQEEVDPQGPIIEITDVAIKDRLRDLITVDWKAEDVRLIAWDEGEGLWRMWKKG